MDLLERPEIKSKYDKCKYIVKLWELKFKKERNRTPSRLDIREADKSVRDAYREYYHIKSAALEQSFKDVDGFHSDEEQPDNSSSTSNQLSNDTQTTHKEPKNEPIQEIPPSVWGSHLDKKIEDDKPKTATKTTSSAAPSKLSASLSQKLFCGSKMSTRNPRKSMSFTSRAKSDVANDSKFLSQPNKSFDVSEVEQHLSFEGLFNKSNVKIANVQEKVQTQSTNIAQLFDNKKRLKSVDLGWLQRVGQSSGVEIEEPSPKLEVTKSNLADESEMCLNYDSDEDIIENSDEEEGMGHVLKKPRLSTSTSSISNVVNNVITSLETPPDERGKSYLKSTEIEPSLKAKLPEIQTKSALSSERKSDPLVFIDDLNESAEKMPRQKKEKVKKLKVLPTSPKIETRALPLRRTKANINLKEQFSDDEDPYALGSDSDDPEFKLNDKKQDHLDKILGDIANKSEDTVNTTTKEKAKPKRKKKVEKEPDEKKDEENDEQDAKYELEYSIKPRVSAPRFKNLKKLIKIETTSKSTSKPSKKASKDPYEIKTKRQQEIEKFEKRIESGNLNENFVTINLKKKIYARGKKSFNFSKFKKSQWKQKKKALCGPDRDMGGCDGGMLTCFNCGQTGHFSRDCKNTNGDKLLSLAAAQADEEEECPFPTLEEAAKQAQESVLATRVSNLLTNASEEPNSSGTDDESDSGDLFDDGADELLLAEALKLDEHVAKLDLENYVDEERSVKPYYQLNADESVIPTPSGVFEALQLFGHSKFRPGQEQAVMRILSGKSTLVTLSTGSGKSLCYQLPAYLYAKRESCISLIVSPLVSLMEDQVTGVPAFLKAACLHTNKTKTQREKIMEAIKSGSLDILLVSPEAVVAGERSAGFGSLLRQLPPIAFACIDEAHCVSQWSHNFRPSYLMICRVLREKMGIKTILGLTATATRSTSDSIIQHLQIPDGRNGIISDIPLPDNLHLTISKDHNRDSALINLLNSERFKLLKSIIIYCTRREECNRLAILLRTHFRDEVHTNSSSSNKKRKRSNVQAEPYHAGLPASRRRTIQNSFMRGDLRIVVATVAFGMGINKPDIRSVIHYNMPKNFESYVQEIGRAGRDGLPAHCHLFLDARGNDENELRRHIFANSIERHTIRKLLLKIFLPCSCKNVCPKHEVAFSIEETVRSLDIPEENISTLLCYLELHEKKYVELLSSAYTVCKVISYGGPLPIRKAAKECPPLAMAMALQNKKDDDSKTNVVEFAVVDIAAAIGWDSGICKHKLKNLEWVTENGMPKRSALSVTFSNLGFRLLAPGNLSDEEMDEALDNLYEHVSNQEKTALLQLRAVHQTLVGVAAPSYRLCLSDEVSEINNELKSKIRKYFESPNPLEDITLKSDAELIVDEEEIVRNVHQILSMYRDNNFTGRAIARIFHGIQSPNYPAVIWGRCKFWRKFINKDFHTISRLATREILGYK